MHSEEFKHKADDMELDKICQNCSSFFQDIENMDLGVCLNDEKFLPFLDAIIENQDFSSCRELYLQERYDGRKEPCEHYEEIEIIEIPEDENINDYLLIEHLKHQNVDPIIMHLYDANNTIVSKAISAISSYVYIGNESAYRGLLMFYMGLGPAEGLDDVKIRMKIVDMLSSRESETSTIDAYVNELARTPSNNTTRQLYTTILTRLSRCPLEMVQEPLIELLGKREYSYKIKNRIMDIARGYCCL